MFFCYVSTWSIIVWVSLTVSGLGEVPQAGLFSKLLDIRWLIRLIIGLIRLDNDP